MLSEVKRIKVNMSQPNFGHLFHWGPISVVAIIKVMTMCMIHHLSLYWSSPDSHISKVIFGVFLVLAAGTLYFMIQSVLEGPGFLPLGWKPDKEDDQQHLQYCMVCKGYKAPRSHHCRKCGKCVLKMDHHCPWINVCVGYNNQRLFVKFLCCAVAGCLLSTVILSWSLYTALTRGVYGPDGTRTRHLALPMIALSLISLGIALGVVLAVGPLLFLQIRGILRNMTAIEEWIVEKAQSRRKELNLQPFKFPYNVGWRRNFYLAMNKVGKGCDFPLAEGCGKYDLTREQKAQKEEKRLRSRLFTVLAPYSGRWIPIWSQPKAAITYPCTDEPRLPLVPGDLVKVTRQKRQWLFGEKLNDVSPDQVRGSRGWFPKTIAVATDQLQGQKND